MEVNKKVDKGEKLYVPIRGSFCFTL